LLSGPFRKANLYYDAVFSCELFIGNDQKHINVGVASRNGERRSLLVLNIQLCEAIESELKKDLKEDKARFSKHPSDKLAFETAMEKVKAKIAKYTAQRDERRAYAVKANAAMHGFGCVLAGPHLYRYPWCVRHRKIW
jgi:hypothetical protein